MFEHGLHAVRPLGVFTEAGLALNGHPCVLGDLPQLVREAPVGENGQSACLVYRESLQSQGFLHIECIHTAHRVNGIVL